MNRRRRSLVAALCALPAAAHAQMGDRRVLKLIVPQAPGGAVDLLARRVAQHLDDTLGAPTIVDNRPGASGVIGCDIASRAPADGYTLLAASTSTHAILPHVNHALPYDSLAAFAPIANLAYTTKLLLVPVASPFATVADLVHDARRRPRALNYGSTGVASSNHLDTAILASTLGIELTHVPFRGSAQAVAALVAGDLDLLIASVTAALGQVRAARLRALCALASQRTPLLPAVPTGTELGLPAIRIPNWIGLVAPAGTPAARVDRINAACNALIESPAGVEWLRDNGMEPAAGTPAQFDATMRADHAYWASVVRELGL